MVSIDAARHGWEIDTRGADLEEREADLRGWMKQNRGALRPRANRFAGGWKDTRGRMCIDVSEILLDRGTGIAAGRKRNPMASFGLNAIADIDAGGSGTHG